MRITIENEGVKAVVEDKVSVTYDEAFTLFVQALKGAGFYPPENLIMVEGE